MARTPTNSTEITDDKALTRRDAEQEMLMREVDEAVRQDGVTTFARKYGWALGIGAVVGLALFGGVLFWMDRQESGLEGESEGLVQALDELQAGNSGIAGTELEALAAGEGGAATQAQLLLGGIAQQGGDTAEAVRRFDQVANNGDLPPALRDLATLRSVMAQYDALEPQVVIDRLGPLASPDNAYYGSAGEAVAHAYLAQGNEEQAGPLLAAIARDEDVPATIRARTRQLAGLLGYDAIDDVEDTLAELAGGAPDAPAVELVD